MSSSRQENIDVLVNIYSQCRGVYLANGRSLYDHSMMCAYLASKDGRENAIVAAALLHDFGHYVLLSAGEFEPFTLDTEHAQIGASWLSRYFVEAVCGPISLHVDAKRYIATLDAQYLSELDFASRNSFINQGGFMTPSQIRKFLNSKYACGALAVRSYDDSYICVNKLPSLEEYSNILKSVMR